MLAIIIGGNYLGITGMLLAIPIAAFIKVLLHDMIENKQKSFHLNQTS